VCAVVVSGPEATRCAACASVTVPAGHVCGDCGVEDHLFEKGRCARCALARHVAELLGGDRRPGPAALASVAEAIAAARQPYSALNWLRKGADAVILAGLAAAGGVIRPAG
jgi:hypothetical protein